jgi:hypothetical protein
METGGLQFEASSGKVKTQSQKLTKSKSPGVLAAVTEYNALRSNPSTGNK